MTSEGRVCSPALTGLCQNCALPITQYRSDLVLGARWYHDDSGERHCAGPSAWPQEDTIREVEREQP